MTNPSHVPVIDHAVNHLVSKMAAHEEAVTILDVRVSRCMLCDQIWPCDARQLTDRIVEFVKDLVHEDDHSKALRFRDMGKMLSDLLIGAKQQQ